MEKTEKVIEKKAKKGLYWVVGGFIFALGLVLLVLLIYLARKNETVQIVPIETKQAPEPEKTELQAQEPKVTQNIRVEETTEHPM